MNNNKELQPQNLDSNNETELFKTLENELDEAIEENRENGELGEECENERLEDWKNKSPEEKGKAIKDKKEESEKYLREDVKVPEDILMEESKLREYQKELRNRSNELIEKRGDFLDGINEQIDGRVDISSLSSMEQGEFRNILSDGKNVIQNTLDIEKIDYYLTEDYFSTEEGIERGLLETHENRAIAMEKLEYLLWQIGEFEKGLKELEGITAEQQEIAKAEVQKIVGRLEEIAEKEPGLFEKLKEAGIVAGIIALALALGVGVANLIKAAGVFAIKVASNKTALTILGGGTIAIGAPGLVGGAAGALVGGGILLKAMSWLSKEENLKKAFGADFPGWYYFLGGEKAGEKKTG